MCEVVGQRIRSLKFCGWRQSPEVCPRGILTRANFSPQFLFGTFAQDLSFSLVFAYSIDGQDNLILPIFIRLILVGEQTCPCGKVYLESTVGNELLFKVNALYSIILLAHPVSVNCKTTEIRKLGIC